MTGCHPWGEWAILAALALSLAACGAPESRATSAPSGGAASASPKTLTIAVADEPGPFITTLLGGSGGAAHSLRGAVLQRLANYDHRGQLYPELAAELPSQERGTWTVRPDGTMQTTYKLRSDVTWHDGVALTAQDFVFGWTLVRDPEMPFSTRLVANQIEAIRTPDQFTLVLDWTGAYPFANAITEDDLGPVPVHLLESVYRANKEQLPLSLYWTREFVGVGPYRLASWEAGSHLVLQAYDRFYRGRGKIDTIIVQFIFNKPTIMANLLAGAIDGTGALPFESVLTVKGEWERAGRTPMVASQVSNNRLVSIQFRNPRPVELLDVRFRRALLHALDRQSMADTFYAGYAPVMDAFMPPDDNRWEWVKDDVVRYPYDARRAQGLLEEAGLRRGPDGVVRSRAGEGLVVPLWTTGGEQSEREIAIMGDYWKAVGIPVDLVVLGPAQLRDNELRAAFPAVETTGNPVLKFSNMLNRLDSSTCPTPETRWSGNNRGCYKNAEWDRVVEALQVAIDPNQQQRLYRDLMKLFSQELPLLPLYFTVDGDIFREGVTGVLGSARGVSGSGSGMTWNVDEWDLR